MQEKSSLENLEGDEEEIFEEQDEFLLIKEGPKEEEKYDNKEDSPPIIVSFGEHNQNRKVVRINGVRFQVEEPAGHKEDFKLFEKPLSSTSTKAKYTGLNDKIRQMIKKLVGSLIVELYM